MGIPEGAGLGLDQLCPMHAVLDATGHIVHAGPTLKKLRPPAQLIGKRFLEVFELRRPRIGTSMAELRAVTGTKLHLRLRDAPHTDLKAVFVALPGTSPNGPPSGAIVNLSFGISVLDGVREFDLTSADFAPTDLTVEMLYLIEAKSAAMEASRTLNQRLQGAKIAAEEQAFTDTLTGLKNRRAMNHVLDRLARVGGDFALMHLDLDFFKAVNDTLGHAAGDHVLQEVARILVDETRSHDTVVRVGGDEFVLVFNRLSDRDRLSDLAARIIRRLEQPIRHDGELCQISGSIGVAVSTDYETIDIPTMMEDADLALYSSKHAGRARFTFYEPTLRYAGSERPGVAFRG